MQGFIYRLPHDQGFYFASNHSAWLFEEETSFPSSVKDLENATPVVFAEFLQDVGNFGMNGFGFNPYRELS